MNQFIEKQQFVVLTPISIGLDSLDIEQEIPYLTEGDIERKNLELDSKEYRPTGQIKNAKHLSMRSLKQSQKPEVSLDMIKQAEAQGYTQSYSTVSIKPGAKVWGKCMPNGSVYLLNSFQGTDYFCSIGAEEVSVKLLSLQSIEDSV